MKFLKILITAILMAVLAVPVQAQKDQVPESLVMNYLKDANPGAEDVNWMSVPGTNMVRITFVEDDVKQYALIDQEGIKYETGSLIDQDNLPGTVLTAFEDTEYADWDVLGIYRSETPYNEELYRFDTMSEADELVTIYFNNFGTYEKVAHNPNKPEME